MHERIGIGTLATTQHHHRCRHRHKLLDAHRPSSIVGITDAVKLQERLGQLDFKAQHKASFL